MMNLSIVFGTVGALAGVVLGAWLTGRSQRALLKESHRQAAITARETAYSEFLAAYRQFRRFVQTEPVKVQLVHRRSGRQSIPVIAQAGIHWEAVENATAKLEILAGDRMSHEVWRTVIDRFYDVARARASCEPGEVPDEIVASARAAETQFAHAARQDLMKSGALAYTEF
jgi:hypothetical protein